MNATQTEAHYREDTAGHRTEVLLDEGNYRHLRFQTPGEPFGWYDLATVPGKLTITGDMGTYVFACEDDMLGWFSLSKNINPHYWSEKIIAADTRNGIKKYSADIFREEVRQLATYFYEDADMDEASAFSEELETRVLAHSEYEHEAREALSSFEHNGFRFSDIDEMNFEGHTFNYLWCCHAILGGIKKYRTATMLKSVA